jgi:hypothetical protein
MEDVGIFYGHLVYFIAIWYILWQIGTFFRHLVYFSVLVCCTKKNLATLINGERSPRTIVPGCGYWTDICRGNLPVETDVYNIGTWLAGPMAMMGGGWSSMAVTSR